jgi:antirestriction protein ArdC
MSNELKPLPEYISGKMIDAIKDGRSIFQKPMKNDGTSQFVLPFNASTGRQYTGSTALILMMQNREDPRWMTYDQASYNETPTKKDSKSTYFNFYSSNVTRPVMKDGEPVMKDNGKPKMERVKLDEPVLVDAFVFNGAQLKDMPEWKPEPARFSPTERAERIFEAGNAAFQGEESLKSYSPHTGTFFKEIDEFPSPELYYATALHELTHWISHDSSINKQADEPEDNIAKEELRTNIASIMISAELNLPYDPGEHANRLHAFVQLMKEDPNELFRAAADAQKMVDFVLDLEWELKLEQQATPAKNNVNKIEKGDVINYNGSQYTVLDKLKHGVYEMQKGEERFKMSSKAGLYTSLLEAKKNPQELNTARNVERPEEQGQEVEQEAGLAEEEGSSYKVKR